MQADLDCAANVRRHRIADHHGLAKLTVQTFTELFSRAVKHVGVGLAEVVSAPARAGLQKRGGRTRATYEMTVDLGRMLGMVVRGPLVGVLRGQLVDSMPGKLKDFVEKRG